MRALRIFSAALSLAVLLGGGFASTAASPAQAQEIAPDALLDRRMARLEKRLALGKDQRPKVRAIQSAHVRRMAGLLTELRKQGSRRERLGVLRHLQSVRKETSARMAGVLSPAQMASYDAFVAEQEKDLRERLKERRATRNQGR